MVLSRAMSQALLSKKNRTVFSSNEGVRNSLVFKLITSHWWYRIPTVSPSLGLFFELLPYPYRNLPTHSQRRRLAVRDGEGPPVAARAVREGTVSETSSGYGSRTGINELRCERRSILERRKVLLGNSLLLDLSCTRISSSKNRFKRSCYVFFWCKNLHYSLGT